MVVLLFLRGGIAVVTLGGGGGAVVLSKSYSCSLDRMFVFVLMSFFCLFEAGSKGYVLHNQLDQFAINIFPKHACRRYKDVCR